MAFVDWTQMTEDPHWIEFASGWLHGADDESELSPGTIAENVQAASSAELELLLASVLDDWASASLQPSRIRALIQWMAAKLIASSAEKSDPSEDSLGLIDAALLQHLYELLKEVDPIASAHALQCLAAQDDAESLATLTELLKSNPPQQWQVVGVGLSPLWKFESEKLAQFFLLMEGADVQVSVLPVLLDLANHSLRSRKMNEHPLERHEPGLRQLLADLVVRLEKLEKDPGRFGTQVEEVQRVLGEGISLTLSLCDALGLIGHPESGAALADAMELSHRRIQAEAAAALVRLGDPRGRQRLVELAADPAARCRVVQYCEELDIVSDIDEQYRTPEALAESELVAWLACPEQFGVPPAKIECLDTRTIYWPGYEEPRNCYLFRYHYEFPSGGYTNLGMAGPLTHTFSTSLDDLDDDEDAYAAFAGWHAEHEEIFEIPAHSLNSIQRREVERLEEAFRREGFRVETRIALTFLLGEPSLLARINREGQSFVGITDGRDLTSFALDNARVASSPELVLAIFRGRKLLRAFNG